jgi:hypothetical protein
MAETDFERRIFAINDAIWTLAQRPPDIDRPQNYDDWLTALAALARMKQTFVDVEVETRTVSRA